MTYELRANSGEFIMIKAGVVGATGYAGAELVRILVGHPQVALTMLTSRQFAGVRFDKIYPAMTGVVDVVCEELATDRLCEHCDVIFTALPHKIPMAIVPDIVAHGKKVIDLSADFRFQDAALYEACYEPHTAKNLLAASVYGLSEIYTAEIRDAMLIGNPGCYPTSALLPLIPLIKNRLIDPQTIVIDSKSGVSGAGRSLSIGSHFCQVNDSFKAYKVAAHRHNPEIDAVLSREQGGPVGVTFVPHLVPMTRGMLTSIYAHLAPQADEAHMRDCLQSFYAQRPFVRICEKDNFPETLHVRNTNYCGIGLKVDGNRNRLILISAIDNLVKGAAGQAVQNMNIMFGLHETTGLMNVPFPI
jgi:N-acetyl-gamma-glutamyl-phosphate reductase